MTDQHCLNVFIIDSSIFHPKKVKSNAGIISDCFVEVQLQVQQYFIRIVMILHIGIGPVLEKDSFILDSNENANYNSVGDILFNTFFS